MFKISSEIVIYISQHTAIMDGDSPKTKKFKEAMKKFRTHFERAESQRRRTIFIDDDDIPSTSRNAPRRCTKQRDRPPSLRGEDHIFF